jgi:hypothetical protein
MLRRAVCLALLASLIPCFAALAERAAGDKVRVRWAGQDVVATVVSVDAKSKLIKVTFEQNGRMHTVVLRPALVRDVSDVPPPEPDKQEKLLELLRTNSDGKNVSTTEYRPWHGPGKAGQKYGPVLFIARVKAYRVGSHVVLFEAIERGKKKELVVKYEQIGNADRGVLFDLLKSRNKKRDVGRASK